MAASVSGGESQPRGRRGPDERDGFGKVDTPPAMRPLNPGVPADPLDAPFTRRDLLDILDSALREKTAEGPITLAEICIGANRWGQRLRGL